MSIALAEFIGRRVFIILTVMYVESALSLLGESCQELGVIQTISLFVVRLSFTFNASGTT